MISAFGSKFSNDFHELQGRNGLVIDREVRIVQPVQFSPERGRRFFDSSYLISASSSGAIASWLRFPFEMQTIETMSFR